MSPERADTASRIDAPRLRASAEALAQRLPPLLVEAERVSATVTPGAHGRRRTGPGDTFWQFRTYQSGDAATSIDWRQSARSRHLFVREQEWEAAESVWLWCDLSKSMRYRSSPRLSSKFERSALLVFALASMLVRGGERVAFLGAGERPAGGRYGLDLLTRCMTSASERPSALMPAPELPRFARVVVLSDFLQPLDGLRSRLDMLAGRGARVSLMQVLDPAEETLPFEGRVLFEGLEQEGMALIDHVGSVRSSYIRLLQAHRDTLRSWCGRRGWSLTLHHTGSPAETGLMALAAMLAPRAIV